VNENEKASWSGVVFATGVTVIILMGGGLVFLWNRLPPQLPWLYSMPWGEQQLIGKEWFAGMLRGLLGMFVLTNFISGWVGAKDEITKNAILGGGLLVVLMYLAGFVRVISVILGI